MSDFARVLPIILKHEGGLVDDPADPGGITNYGISFRFLKAEGIDIDMDGDVDADDIRGLTPEQAGRLYERFFWDAGDYIRIVDQTAATKMMDCAVNMGGPRAHKLASLALLEIGLPAEMSRNIHPDGKLDAWDFAGINSEPAAWLTAMCREQAKFYQWIAENRPRSAKFLPGWLKRAAWPFKRLP